MINLCSWAWDFLSTSLLHLLVFVNVYMSHNNKPRLLGIFWEFVVKFDGVYVRYHREHKFNAFSRKYYSISNFLWKYITLLLYIAKTNKDVLINLMIWVIYLCTKCHLQLCIVCRSIYTQPSFFIHICQIILLLSKEKMMSEQDLEKY